MVQVPDEFLMAYADGQVSPEERAWFEGMLAGDPALRQRLQPFIATGPRQWSVFDSALNAPVPDRLIAAIRSGGSAAPSRSAVPQPKAAKPASARPGLFDRLFPGGFGLHPGFGYAAALLIGLGAGSAMLRPAAPDNALLKADRDGFVATGRLQVALDRTPSNDKKLVTEGDIRPLLTVRDREGRVCRQYEIVSRLQKGPQGLACREADGDWRITVLTGGAENEGSARTASQNDQAALDGVLGNAVKGMSELTAPEELYLIENGWGRAPNN